MVDILHRMNQEDDDDGVDSDDDDDPLDLADRLAGVNLDDAGETWAVLTAEERRQFSELLQSGDVTSVLPGEFSLVDTIYTDLSLVDTIYTDL